MPDISPDAIAAAQAAERTYGILASIQLAQFGQNRVGSQVKWQEQLFRRKGQRVPAWEHVRHA